ncbi:MAG: hypothetical protein HGGPFJEG_01964 [Ignavibacteria bacterium]|nr:hypothetical protein [Ignavibacteria bacterium]
MKRMLLRIFDVKCLMFKCFTFSPVTLSKAGALEREGKRRKAGALETEGKRRKEKEREGKRRKAIALEIEER